LTTTGDRISDPQNGHEQPPTVRIYTVGGFVPRAAFLDAFETPSRWSAPEKRNHPRPGAGGRKPGTAHLVRRSQWVLRRVQRPRTEDGRCSVPDANFSFKSRLIPSPSRGRQLRRPGRGRRLVEPPEARPGSQLAARPFFFYFYSKAPRGTDDRRVIGSRIPYAFPPRVPVVVFRQTPRASGAACCTEPHSLVQSRGTATAPLKYGIAFPP